MEREEHGFAVILTLMILALLTILLVAFVSNVQVERISAKSFSNEGQVRLAAEGAVEQAIYQLSQFTAATNYITYVSNYVYGGGVTNPVTHLIVGATSVPGFTTDYLTGTTLSTSNNFNAQGHMFPTSMVSSLNIPWVVYTNNLATNSFQQRRSITRYAWWIDDESSKINLNWASNTNGVGMTNSRSTYTVASIDMKAIPGIDDNLRRDIVTNRAPLYESAATVMEVPGVGFSAQYDAGIRVFGTVYSADDEIQTNWRTRVNPNTIVATAASPHIAVTNLFNAITNAYPTYKNKYGGVAAVQNSNLYQICANMVDYIDADSLPTDLATNDWSGGAYFGREQAPYINEVFFRTEVVRRTPTGTTNYVMTCTNYCFVELLNLYTNAFTASNLWLRFTYPPITIRDTSNRYVYAGGIFTTNFPSITIPAYSGGASGGIRVFTNMINNFTTNNAKMGATNPGTLIITNGAPGAATTPMSITNVLRVAASSGRLDYAVIQLPFQTNRTATTTFPNDLYVTNSSSAVDPRSHYWTNTWRHISTLAPTLGITNASWTPNTLGDSNAVADLGTDGGYFFANAPLQNVGEIGNIMVPPTVGASSPYFRTLKLYGDGYASATEVPDWALLDLFTVTNAGARIDGKININTQRDLLKGANDGALQALLLSVPRREGGSVMTQAEAQAIATNIMSGAPYFHIGQLGSNAVTLFTKTIGSDAASTDQRREAIIRALSNIITVRGNHFTIYGMGQSLTVLQGKTNVIGEAFTQAVVERVPLTNSVGTVTGQVYRTKYFRTLAD